MSPLLLWGVDIDKAVSMDLRIGWKELFGVAVSPADYKELDLDQSNEEMDLAPSRSDNIDALLVLDASIADGMAQLFNGHATTSRGPSNCFAAPRSTVDVEAVKKS